MLKAAIVGCGKIADAHASQLLRTKRARIVGVCDREPLMARQLHERFPVARSFSDLRQLLNEAKPDVVHITTPPQTHFDIAMECLASGCHVYVEKPFTVDALQAERLIAYAQDRRLKVTVGHDEQFCHAARRMRSLVRAGFLGDGAVHLESYYCYELSGAYVSALTGDSHHWVRRLPGKLLHNIISHGIARIAEFLHGHSAEVVAYGFASPFLRSVGETELMDELRVIVCDRQQTTAYFTFSSQMRPALHEFRVFGNKNGLVLDQDQETLITLRGRRFKAVLEKFIPPVQLATQQLWNSATNCRKFMANDLHAKSGMKYLIDSFYNCINGDKPVPIPYREIVLTAKIMDSIFHQLSTRAVPDLLARKT